MTGTLLTITPTSAGLTRGAFTSSLTAAGPADKVTLIATKSGKRVTSAAFSVSVAGAITDTTNGRSS